MMLDVLWEWSHGFIFEPFPLTPFLYCRLLWHGCSIIIIIIIIVTSFFLSYFLSFFFSSFLVMRSKIWRRLLILTLNDKLEIWGLLLHINFSFFYLFFVVSTLHSIFAFFVLNYPSSFWLTSLKVLVVLFQHWLLLWCTYEQFNWLFLCLYIFAWGGTTMSPMLLLYSDLLIFCVVMRLLYVIMIVTCYLFSPCKKFRSKFDLLLEIYLTISLFIGDFNSWNFVQWWKTHLYGAVALFFIMSHHSYFLHHGYGHCYCHHHYYHFYHHYATSINITLPPPYHHFLYPC